MSVWSILQVAIDLLFFAGLGLCFVKFKTRREEDPRLSYGLKLLQNKIAIIEDLSDKTDHQVKQLVAMMENKLKDLQSKIQESDKQLKNIDQAMGKTLEVAQIFQNQVPHEAIMERKTSNKYITAARMAHQGMSHEQISQAVDLPAAELDLIIKVNRENLTFSEEHLPAWVEKHPLENNEKIFQPPQVDISALEKLGADFKKACMQFEEKNGMRQESTNEEPANDGVVPYSFKKHNDFLYK
jgi:hypothetical protein